MNIRTKQVILFLAALALVCWASLPTYAQTTRGTITGTVSDESGAVVAGAKVTVTQIDQGLTWDTTTDASGNYVVPSLFPGRYRVEAEMKGFQKTVIEPLQLHVDERLAVDPVLKVGAVTQQVEVTSRGEIVQTASSSISQVVGTKMVLDLPLNGRNFLQLGLLSPGTNTPPPGTVSEGRGGIGISGGRVESNQFSLDGIYNGSTAYGDLNVAISVDAIEEFKIQRNTFSAEFGYGTGQVNVATKSGANSFHGSVYEFIRNNTLDARQFFDAEIPPFRQNQFGASVGGPIRKDKTFFFANYEGFRWRRDLTLIGTLPTAAMLAGTFSSPIIDPLTRGTPGGPTTFANNQIPTNPNRFSALSTRILAYLPRPATGGANNYTTTAGSTQDWDQMTFRVDHRVSSKDSFFARYTLYKDLNTHAPYSLTSGTTNKTRPQNVTLQWIHSFSANLLNEVRLGLNREMFTYLQDGAYGPDVLQFTNIVADPINHGLPVVAIAGYAGFGTPATYPMFRGSNVYQYSDNLTWIRGRHTLKFGGGFRAVQQPHWPFLMTRGYYVFQGFNTGNAVADFLLGNPFVAIGAGKAPVSFQSFHFYDSYLQDDWKVAPRLTLNFGMRYERVGTTTDRFRGRLGIFDEATGQLVGPGAAVDQAGLVNPDNLGFQPRFGFSWQPFSKPHTVLRGGFGVYNGVKAINERNFSLGSEIAWQQIVDINALLGLPPAVTWDNLFPAAPPLGGVGILSDDPRSRDPYSMMYSLGIQRDLAFDSVLEVDYVGQVQRKQMIRIDINQAALPPLLPNGQPDLTSPIGPRRPYPSLGSVLMVKDIASGNYNSLQVRFEKRYSRNLSFLAGYTWSKAMDNGSFCDIGGCNALQNNKNMAAEYGRSSSDQRHRLVMSPMYLLPFGKGQKYLSNLSGVPNALVKGWQVNSIISFASGTPFPVQEAGGDRTQTGNFGGGKQFANCIGPGMLPNNQRTVQRDFNTSAFELAPLGTFGNCGRDILTSRGTNNWDISLFKNTSLTEGTTLQFRAEFFNAFNHPQFGIPNYDPTNAAFGQISSVGRAREIQFALKLLF
jgi:outer membrane receptor protein involved in Fe transport